MLYNLDGIGPSVNFNIVKTVDKIIKHSVTTYNPYINYLTQLETNDNAEEILIQFLELKRVFKRTLFDDINKKGHERDRTNDHMIAKQHPNHWQ